MKMRRKVTPGLFNGLLFLFLAYCFFSWINSFTSFSDLDPLDEPGVYLKNAFLLLENGGDARQLSPDWGPLYSYWYAFLLLFEKDPLTVYKVSGLLLNAGLLILFFLYLLIRKNFHGVTAALVTILLALNPYYFLASRRPYHFALILLFSALILSSLPAWKKVRWWTLSLGFLLAGFVRPEYFLGHFLLYPFLIRRERRTPLWIGGMGLFLLLTYLLGGLQGRSVKGLDVFYEANHDRLVREKRHPVTLERDRETPPYFQYEKELYQQPGGLVSALIHNPGEFFHHVFSNVTGTLSLAGTFLTSSLPIVWPWPGILLVTGLFLFFSLSLLSAPSGIFREEWAADFLGLFPFVLSCLLFLPREEYFLAPYPFLLAFFLAPLKKSGSQPWHTPFLLFHLALFVLLGNRLAPVLERKGPPIFKQIVTEMRNKICGDLPAFLLASDVGALGAYLPGRRGFSLLDDDLQSLAVQRGFEGSEEQLARYLEERGAGGLLLLNFKKYQNPLETQKNRKSLNQALLRLVERAEDFGYTRFYLTSRQIPFLVRKEFRRECPSVSYLVPVFFSLPTLAR